MTPREQRVAHSRKAWKEAFDRLCALAGPDVLAFQASPELALAEAAASDATAAYIDGDRNSHAGETLATWERIFGEQITANKLPPRGRDVRVCACGAETAVMLDDGGVLTCSRCCTGAFPAPLDVTAPDDIAV